MVRVVRRSVAFVLALCATATLVGRPASAGRDPVGPVLVVADDVPNDVRALALDTWEMFLTAFPARRACIPPVTLTHAWEFADRAAYDPAERAVVLRVPGTAPNLRASLVHEFAHHLESTCDAQASLRRPFLVATGSAPNSSWFGGRDWERVPSERFAEAVTVYVLDERPSHLRVSVPREALDEIERWAVGS
jgi:hypothetical protein